MIDDPLCGIARTFHEVNGQFPMLAGSLYMLEDEPIVKLLEMGILISSHRLIIISIVRSHRANLYTSSRQQEFESSNRVSDDVTTPSLLPLMLALFCDAVAFNAKLHNQLL